TGTNTTRAPAAWRNPRSGRGSVACESSPPVTKIAWSSLSSGSSMGAWRRSHNEPALAPACRSVLAACALLASWPLGAQWIDYPTAGVPRKADGSPDLEAPAPRTPDGKPDLSGLWTAAEVLPECSADECIPQQNLPVDQVNIGRTLP